MMRRDRVDHVAVAAMCRTAPGEWQPVGEYNSRQSADGAAGYIRNARINPPAQQSAYAPAGSFEARRTLTEFGARVEARYVGDSNDAARKPAEVAS
ncbi:hypothetical protein [Streptomyces sp. NPDC059786]|uniref:hypothetical protein n=1 Tax=Streptomyces sp. NPDC059786 TaxID=3346946 RepID=UPI003664749F